MILIKNLNQVSDSMTRTAKVSRKTSETDIEIELNIDDLNIKAIGDIEIDDHHTVEDVGILLGEAFFEAIGDKKGIRRMGHAIVPMDDSVATVAIDISGRSYCNMDLDFKHDKIGDLSSDVVVHFFESFASSAKINIYGTCEGANDHHKAEALFKAFAKSLYDACKIEHDEILSTKGVL